jgi:tRNA(Ile2) C34 agmatinyltransferase TiaS
MSKIYRYYGKLNKWVIRCPHCKNAYISTGKDIICVKCNRKIDDELTKRLNNLSKALSQSIRDDMRGK